MRAISGSGLRSTATLGCALFANVDESVVYARFTKPQSQEWLCYPTRRILREANENPGGLSLTDFPMYERFNDGPQEFLSDDLHYLGPHLVQNLLDHGFD